MKKSVIAASMIVTSVLAAPVWAGHKSKGGFDYAKVVSVTPITETVEYHNPRQQCWNERVSYQEPVYSGYSNTPAAPRSYTGTILGGLIGGAIGNELGHSNTNKKVGAAAGAILGASIGRDITNRRHKNRQPVVQTTSVTRYRTEQRCETVDEIDYHEQIVGYDVDYKYNGRRYSTRMDQHPGDKIEVIVDVRPVY